MMKKPPGLWLLLSAGVLWLCFQDVCCVRATSLIFGKSTTTTTITPGADASESSSSASTSASASEEENASDTTSSNSTQPKYTGIPQVDYQWDPNLPRELNGFNLTEYPFYDRLPEDIDFKCDGLHDGFYASVPHKCQVYHHCLFGTRYDFLCANYTAFDQKTFICHFVSEVDCVNSKKFWHRNDALYKAATTTTQKPVITYAPPPQPAVIEGNNGGNGGGRRGQGQVPATRRRKPTRRRRPQYDYYDEYEADEEEYYDEPRYTATEPTRSEGRRRKPRPRPRPRPIYDDEYEEYEDDRYDRRRGSSRRGEDERRYRTRPTSRRNKEDRRKYEDEYEEYEEEDPRFDRSEERRKKPKDDRRRPPASDEKRTEKRPSDDRRYDKRRQEDDLEEEERRPRPRKGQRKPIEDDYEEEERRPASKRKEDSSSAVADEGGIKPLVKPLGTSVYDRPRVAPRIRPPVPKSEADKYAYKTTMGPAVTNPTKLDDQEYYEDYEEEPLKKRPAAKDSQPDATITTNTRRTTTKNYRDRDEVRRNRPAKIPKRPVADEEYYYEEEEERPRRVQKPKNDDRRVGLGSRKRPATQATVEYEEDIDYEEDLKVKDRNNKNKSRDRDREFDRERAIDKITTPTSTTTTRRKYGHKDLLIRTTKPATTTSTTTTTTSTTTTTTTEPPTPPPPPPSTASAKDEQLGGNIKSVRIVKRPFLPSRGGNPYIARGLLPIGLKAESQRTQESRQHEEEFKEEPEEEEIVKPTQILRKPQDVVVENYRTPNNRQNFKAIMQYPTQTQKPVEKNPLDINENEYDVTLNDALNPTLPNLPLRQFPSGFSNNVNQEYTFGAFHRPRYVVDATINQAGSEYQYRFKQVQPAQQQQHQEAQQIQVPQSIRYEIKQTNGHGPQHGVSHHSSSRHTAALHDDFAGQYTTNYQQFRPSPRIAHSQTYYMAY